MPRKLAIAIPTYSRVKALAENLPKILVQAERLGVGVYLSDDSHDNETERLVQPLLGRYRVLNYRHNNPPLRHDGNIRSTMSWPDAEYVWILGDVLRPKEDELSYLLRFLDHQDIVFLNVNSPNDDAPTIREVDGENARKLVLRKLWHQTLTGSTIYHKRVIKWAESALTETHANFPHIDVILGYVGSHSPKIGWLGRKIVHVEQRHKSSSYWRTRGLDVFVDDWVSVVKSYPNTVHSAELKSVLRSHSASTNLFNLEYLHTLVQSGHFGVRSFFRPHFWDVMHEPKLKILLAFLPRSIFRALTMLKARRTHRS